MMPEFNYVLLLTDFFLYVILIALGVVFCMNLRNAHHRQTWRYVFQKPLSMVAFMVLCLFIMIALLDSIHYRLPVKTQENSVKRVYQAEINSLLDYILSPMSTQLEKTYSRPFALTQYSREMVNQNGQARLSYPRLQFAGRGLNAQYTYRDDLIKRMTEGVLIGGALSLLLYSGCLLVLSRLKKQSIKQVQLLLWRGQLTLPWRTMLITMTILIIAITIIGCLIQNYHILGTDKIGEDVFYIAVKSIRTGVVIGTLTTLVMLPFALVLGLMAGFFKGVIDDIIQYIYTVLSSVPAVLLIAAVVLSMQIYIDNHPGSFPNIAERADMRLLILCLILGVTSWTTLCRLLRAEALKLREMDYVQAAKTLNVSNLRIIARHILPNTTHIILITVVLDFSALVLAEAVLSYVGVGVVADTMSWGNMINSARLELARDPIVWWPLLAAFVFMFTLVLSANLFADSVRDAFDPRTNKGEL